MLAIGQELFPVVAESLVNKSAAVLIVQKDLTVARLRDEILNLKNAPETRARMARSIRDFHQPRAAEKLVEKFVERIEQDASG